MKGGLMAALKGKKPAVEVEVGGEGEDEDPPESEEGEGDEEEEKKAAMKDFMAASQGVRASSLKDEDVSTALESFERLCVLCQGEEV